MKTVVKNYNYVIHKLSGFIKTRQDDPQNQSKFDNCFNNNDNFHFQESYHSVNYKLFQDLELSVGQTLRLRHHGDFQCSCCARKVKKLFSSYCFPCLRTKAEADNCVMSPHLCHYQKGTCREPAWGDDFCYQAHYVYLSFTDKFKVGITRKTQIPYRWIDQGASAAMLLAEVTSRHQAGQI
ncbi:MAG: DUF2797 domain-containing protein, partial [Silvanigrellaceae bacterium]|nr:DUF2797 domain-containing protein [Silvanigrellaceae bacterium]